MITVYLAASWKERDHAREVRESMKANGIEVNSRWLDTEGSDEAATDETRGDEALKDIEDVLSADVFVLLNTQKRGEETSGKAVETGIAIMATTIEEAKTCAIIVVGEKTNVFHYLHGAMFNVATPDDAIKLIKEWEALQPPQKGEEQEVVGGREA